MKTKMAEGDPAIGRGWRLGAYASGNFGKNILWGTGEVTLLFMLTDLLGLNPALAGSLLLASLVFDAVLDPLVGHIADRFPSRLGKFGGLIILGAPVAALSFVALYSLPLLSAPSALLVFFLIFGFRLGYSLIDAPHNALLARVRPDGPGRARLAGYRFFFSSLASFIIAFALAPLVGSDSNMALSPGRLFVFAMIVAVLSCLVMILSWLAIRRVDVSEKGDLGREAFSMGAASQAALKSPLMLTTLTVGTIAAFALPLFNKSVLYLTTSFLGRPDWASPVLLALVAGQFAGLGFWIWLSSTHSKSKALALAHIVSALGAGACLVMGLDRFYGLLAGAFVFGVGASGVYTIIWGLVADSVDDVCARTGVRPDGRLFSLAIFLQKVAIGLGVGLFGLALGWSGYVAGEPNPAANTVIITFGLALPTMAAVICACILTFIYSADQIAK